MAVADCAVIRQKKEARWGKREIFKDVTPHPPSHEEDCYISRDLNKRRDNLKPEQWFESAITVSFFGLCS